MGSETDNETCQRCGVTDDPDLRTLWHACMYEMGETGLPFALVRTMGTAHAHTGEQEVLPRMLAPTFAEAPNGPPQSRVFYTLRVCKDCRASWMDAIAGWFRSGTRPEATGTGVYVRRGGANVELTEAEVAELERSRGGR